MKVKCVKLGNNNKGPAIFMLPFEGKKHQIVLPIGGTSDDMEAKLAYQFLAAYSDSLEQVFEDQEKMAAPKRDKMVHGEQTK